ncbi:MAG: mannose-1-phosphate guanylyltransferase [Verrucomicrobia bacterium]|nr:mannose-1-phosphate guanylyltransferase [Verrucomicrobiota bacterium]
MSNSFYALVLAGGSGERFWPLSRKATPKQLLRLFSSQSLLEETVHRLDGLVPLENILVLTNQEQEAAVRRVLPEHPENNIVAEPAKRDTAAAIALGVGIIAARNASATMAVLPADHRISDKAAFQLDLKGAAQMAERTGDLVTIGITPTWACPGFGYIERGKQIGNSDAFEVIRFREKPNPDLAESFVRSGNFYWNAGMFIWSVNSILTEFNRHAPDLAEFVSAIRNSPDKKKVLADRFRSLRKTSIDYAIMEKASRVLVKPATFDWDDVGGWTAISKYLEQLSGNNAANCPVTVETASNNIVFSDSKTHVALLGVNDLVIVQSKDAILVCHRHDVEKIKNLIPKVPERLQ